jgi:hypothetical protein
MDSAKEAQELTRVFVSRFGSACRSRPTLGPLVWKAVGAEIVVAAGPYERDGATARGGGTCELAARFADAMLHARP